MRGCRRLAFFASIVMCVAVASGVGDAAAQTRRKAQTQQSSSKAKKDAGKQPAKARKEAATQPKSGGSARRSSGKSAPAPRSSAEARRLQEAAQKDIVLTKEQLRLNEEKVKAGLADLNSLSADIAAGRTKVEGLQKKVSSLAGEIGALEQQIATNEAELQRMREEYLKAVKKMRLTRRNQSALAFIFASDNFNQALRRLRYMKQFSQWKEKQTEAIDLKIKQLGSEKESLARAKEQHSATLGQLSASQRDLEGKHEQQQQLVAELRKNGTALQAHLAAKQNEANRLKESIATLIAREQAEAERQAREKAEAERKAREQAEAKARAKAEAEAKAKAEAEAKAKAEAERKAAEEKEKNQQEKSVGKKTETSTQKKEEKKEDKKKGSEKGSRTKKDRKPKTPATPSPGEASSSSASSSSASSTASSSAPAASSSSAAAAAAANVNFASLRGSLPRPVDGAWRITNAFGRHSMPEMPEVVYDNPGIDAEVTTGSAVKAVCPGKVSGVYKVAGYGNVVIVNHGEYYTVYGNLSSVSVANGATVKSGQPLGTAAPDPDDSRRGSVHFEVWKGREKQNPALWLR